MVELSVSGLAMQAQLKEFMATGDYMVLFPEKRGDPRYDKEARQRLNTPVRVMKIGRNEPCLCGSGRKYKVCCGN